MHRGFELSFPSFHADRYALGTPMPNVASYKGDTCSFLIYSRSKRVGEVMTPTYPGTYPKNMNCSYKFVGAPDQRLRLEFREEEAVQWNWDVFRAAFWATFWATLAI